jgi:hypothetical protein
MCGLAILAGLLGVILLLGDLATAANVAQLISVVLAGSSSVVGLIAWRRSRPTPQPSHGTPPPQPPPPASGAAGAIVSLVALVALIAGVVLGPKLLSTDAPDDAPGLFTAHVGDCVGSKAGAYRFWVVPCWYKAATYRVVNIGLRRIMGPTNHLTPADALSFCQDSPGWDATGRHVPAYPDDFTAVTVCLVHT